MRGVQLMTLIGVGYRRELAGWIDSSPAEIQCLEITAEHFFDGGHDRLGALADRYPLFVHGLGLSLGTPGPLDRETLEQFTAIVESAQPKWVSEHIALTRSAEVDLGHLNPVAPTAGNLQLFADHVRELSSATGRDVILENITTHIQLSGEMSETAFINRLCEQARCGLLLDVTNLFINARNHQFDAVAWLHELQPELIRQLHVIGYAYRNGRYYDTHAVPLQDDLLELIAEVCGYANVEAVTLEWDAEFPSESVIAGELHKLQEVCSGHCVSDH